MDTKRVVLMSLGMAAAALPTVGYALSLPLRIRYEKAFYADLPPHLRALKILHISDLHGRYTNKMHRDIWPAIMSLDFDMAVITGDIILNKVAQIYPHMDGLRAMAKKAPSFYVDGNHEAKHYTEIAKLFEGIGIESLFNRRGNFAVGLNDKSKSAVLSIAGFRDYYHLHKTRFKDALPLIEEISNSGDFHVILSHQPQIFNLLCKRRISGLVLAGHTHGGQVRLPFFPTLLAPGQGILPRYGEGWYNSGDLKMYISRGVGATHFHLRLFNPPEVAVIELQKG